jgi:uncharacterized membrane protein
MRSREEIKEIAKQAFAAQRGDSILALFVVNLVVGGLSLLLTLPMLLTMIPFIMDPTDIVAITAFSGASTLVGLLYYPLIFLSMILTVNLCGVFVKVYYGQPIKISEPFTELKNSFGRKLGGSLWEYLWIYLWSMVGIFSFFIPTLLKALSYSMTKYILANNPNVKATDALKLSMRMTQGHRGKIFVLYLSFIGWWILSGLTFGILAILYVNPYVEATFAGYFVELRNLAVANGVIHISELDGVSAYYPQYQQYPPAAPYAPQSQYHQPSPYMQQPQQPLPGQPYAPVPHLQQPLPGQPYAPVPHLQQPLPDQPYAPVPPPPPSAPPPSAPPQQGDETERL